MPTGPVIAAVLPPRANRRESFHAVEGESVFEQCRCDHKINLRASRRSLVMAHTRVRTAARPRAHRSSVERVHRLLSSFDYEHKRLSLSDLSRRANLPLSTTHRMVTELLELGMLERDQHHLLSIGVELW